MTKIWESTEEPEKLFRLQGFLNLTRNVEQKTRTNENGEEETFYQYEVIRLKDRPMPQDIDAFLLQNYAEIRESVIMDHWHQEKQNEAITENVMGRSEKIEELNAFINSLKFEYPKP